MHAPLSLPGNQTYLLSVDSPLSFLYIRDRDEYIGLVVKCQTSPFVAFWYWFNDMQTVGPSADRMTRRNAFWHALVLLPHSNISDETVARKRKNCIAYTVVCRSDMKQV